MEKNHSSLKSPSKCANELNQLTDPILSLDRPYLPECWADDKRMDVLFNPFRIREINPEAVFTLDEFRHNFIRDGRMPHLDCCRLILTHMKRQRKLLFKDELFPNRTKSNQSEQTLSLLGWTLHSLIVRPISYGWNYISSKFDENVDKIMPIYQEYPLINVETLNILTETVESSIKNSETTCMSYQKFLHYLNRNVFAEKKCDQSTLETIVLHLQHRNRLRIYEESNFKIVKFGKQIELKDTDITLVRLEITREILEKESLRLEEKMNALNEDARQAVRNNSKDKALLFLKRKKRLENRLNEKDQQIDNIEVLCGQLLETDSQQLMMQAFQIANNVLKRNTAKIDDVENVMMQIDETLTDVSNVNQELSRNIGDTARIELEAEKELEGLLKEINNDEDAIVSSPRSKSIPDDEKTLLDELNKLTIPKDSIEEKISDFKSSSLPNNDEILAKQKQQIKTIIPS
ncbi:Charged multivesicular body protein 7 [Sarcoptes scabiei]|uniref:Charged multivesicular body protein 7 n=2 Tax=Sarcoptes scabiei TaxID=52283 RepID=A0A834VBQ9_SARSC|nr:Charged multivesicular body protein 7 [Sarcoptes scabiei]